MKNTFFIAVLLCGCQTSKIELGGGNRYEGKSFFVPRKIESVSLTSTDTNGVSTTFMMKGYTTKEAQLAGALAEGAVKGAINSQVK
jgi:hypothetical protein